MVACAPDRAPQPPRAKAFPKADTLHGDIRIDPYGWLKERDNPDVIAYLEGENGTASIHRRRFCWMKTDWPRERTTFRWTCLATISSCTNEKPG
ncbi:MAG: hypothetical protein ACE5HZ_07300 [Fidelibacterota bacterium]